MKRLITLILAVILLLSLTMPAAAAGKKIKASTMRLELIEGAAEIKNSSGVKQSYNAGMRLYSGYTITTSQDSYAYISLDDTKAVKLDMLTTVRLKQSGKKLQIQLVTGQVLANTTVPLASSETLEIRTSTMVTGIRGTMVTVTVEGAKTNVYLTETTGFGATVTNLAKSNETVTLGVGQRYTCENGVSEVADFKASELPAFTQAELLNNPALRGPVEAQGILDLSQITKESLQKKLQEEAVERGLTEDTQTGSGTEPYGEEDPYTPPEEPEYPDDPQPSADPQPTVYSVTLPESGDFYTVETVSAGDDGSCAFTVRPEAGYEDSTFTVYANGAVLEAADGVYAIQDLTANVTVTVEAKKIPTTYYFIYELNEGSLIGDYPKSYTIESEAVSLPVPVKEGFTFLGWTGTNLSEPTADVVIPSGSTGDRNYVANWAADLPVVPTVSWSLTDGTMLCEAVRLSDDVCEPAEGAEYASSGSVSVESGADFVFALENCPDLPLVYAGGTLLDPAVSGETELYYVLSGVTADTVIEVKQGVLCQIDLPEGSEFIAEAPGSVQEETEGGVMLIVPMGNTVSFTLTDDVLVYLNEKELKPADGVYAFTATENTKLRFVPCIAVTDGSPETLTQALADAKGSGLTVLIDCNIHVPEESELSFCAPAVLAEGCRLSLAASAEVSAELYNNGSIEVLEGGLLLISEGAYLCNNGTITVDGGGRIENYGSMDNMEGALITFEVPEADLFGELQNSGCVQDFGSVVNPDCIVNNEGSEYRLWTDDAGIFLPYGSLLMLPGYITDMTFTGDLTIESDTRLYINHAVFYMGTDTTLTISEGGAVQVDVFPGDDLPACLVLDNGSELVLNGRIYMNDPAGFRDNECRYTTNEMLDDGIVTYEVIPAAAEEVVVQDAPVS